MGGSPLYARRKLAGGGLSKTTRRPLGWTKPSRVACRHTRAELRLQGLLDGERLGEDEQAGGLTIEPMDDEDPPAFPRPHPGAEQAVCGPLALGFGRDRQEPRGLLDDHEVLVLMNEPERRREAGGRW